MSSNVIEFQSEVEKHRVPDVVAAPMVDPPEPSHYQYVIELEHEAFELRMAISEMALELFRCREQLRETVTQ
jgi:hypothetical protein